MKKRRSKSGNLSHHTGALGALEYLGSVNIPTTIELVQYNEEECLTEKLKKKGKLTNEIREGYVSWFQITGISDADYISKVCKDFDLHGFDIRELLSDSQIVKFVLYKEVTFALISAYFLNGKEELEHVQIAFILGDSFVVSFQESPVPLFKEIQTAIDENNITLRRKGADFLFYALLHAVNIFNNDFILHSEDKLWEIEDQLILQQENIDVLHILRKQREIHMHLKRYMASLKDEYENLLENSNGKVSAENVIYFENLEDKYRLTSNNIDSYVESVKSLLDLYYHNNAMRMNEIMKRLTLVATIFIPLTFLVGVWGMNFTHMPELKWKYGYLASWVIFVLIVLFIIYLMKKKKWF